LYDNDVKFEVRGYTFPFTLYAAKEVQQFIYENGLGHFAHKGFGMLDVANNDSIQRTPQHDVNYA
jgi:CRISPR-associated endoribonuclease Cas6